MMLKLRIGQQRFANTIWSLHFYWDYMFQELLNNCNNEKSIFLGNGFGMAFDAAMGQNNFNWNSLLDLCDIENGSELHKLLSENRFDFELAHQKLNSAIDVLSLYEPDLALIEHLNAQIQYLRNQLIIAIGNSHPSSFIQERPQKEQDHLNEKISNCRVFLKKFNTVYSLNYDLLLYWVRCSKKPFLGQDSFTELDDDLIFSPSSQANYFFPHGALFLYREGASAIKSRSSVSYPILSRLEAGIRAGRFPMCISEGTGEQKLKEIKKNYYLSYAYNKIKESRGTIFTFGCSFLNGKDNHIIEAMCTSNANRIVVGEFRPTPASRLRLEHEFARVQENLKTNKEVIVANTEGTEIW